MHPITFATPTIRAFPIQLANVSVCGVCGPIESRAAPGRCTTMGRNDKNDYNFYFGRCELSSLINAESNMWMKCAPAASGPKIEPFVSWYIISLVILLFCELNWLHDYCWALIRLRFIKLMMSDSRERLILVKRWHKLVRNENEKRTHFELMCPWPC